MFDKQFFGYDKNQVEEQINSMNEKIEVQRKDLEYLREENGKLKKKIKTKQKHKEEKSV